MQFKSIMVFDGESAHLNAVTAKKKHNYGIKNIITANKLGS